jgi:hypothetical protein
VSGSNVDYGLEPQPSITLDADDLAAVQAAIRIYGDLRAAEALEEAAEELARPRTGLAGLLDMASYADQQRATQARWLRGRAAALRGGRR